MKDLTLIITISLLLIAFTYSFTCEELVSLAKNEGELKQSLMDNFATLKTESTSCIEHLLLTGNYKALENYVTRLNKEGIKFRETLSNSVNNIQNKLQSLVNKYQFEEKDFQQVTPAFMWAQSLDTVFVQVKFSHRFDSPGCSEIGELTTVFKKRSAYLSGDCIQSEIPIKFVLDLKLLEPIDKKNSVYVQDRSPYFKLKKREAKYWATLVAEEHLKDYPQIKVWFEMKLKYEDEIKKFEKSEEEEEKSFEQIEQELLEEKRKKKEENKGKKKKKKGKKNSEKKKEL